MWKVVNLSIPDEKRKKGARVAELQGGGYVTGSVNESHTHRSSRLILRKDCLVQLIQWSQLFLVYEIKLHVW